MAQHEPTQHRHDRGMTLGAHAIVVGGGIAGLVSARALADHFETVTVIERDPLTDDAVPRPGVPQATHLHFLQAGGLEGLCTLFPDFEADLEQAGAVRIRMGLDFRDEVPGLNPLPRRDLGITSYTLTRPLLEHLIRRRLSGLPNVTIRDRCRALRLLTAPDGDISGELLASASGKETLVSAFVVDATGRDALTADLLRDKGWTPPAETRIGVDIGYATAVFAMPARLPTAWKGVAVRPAPPRSLRGAIMVPIEGRRWILSLAGVQKDQPPFDEAGFMAFVRDLPTSTIEQALQGAVRLGDIRRFRLPESVWRRHDRIERCPEGVVPMADGICRFNPIYGQGMTVAIKEALVLARLLRERAGTHDPLVGFNRAFQTAILPLIDAAWSAAAVPDFAFPLTRGERPEDLAERMQFSAAAFRAAFHDPEIHRTLFEVRQMLKPPGALRSPDMEARILAERVSR
ncbi:MAG: FAD-dependent oxidoreductase [Janthinobacterium lividum]